MFASIDICMTVTPIKNNLARTLDLDIDINLDLDRALDTALNTALDTARTTIASALALALDRTRDRFLDLARARTLDLELACDLGRALAFALAPDRDRDPNYDFDLDSFRKILLDDIKTIAGEHNKEISNDTSIYGHYWSDFQRVLVRFGCGYWADVYTNLWSNGFREDMNSLEHRLQLPREYFEKGAAEAAKYLLSLENVGSKTLREARMLILGDAGSGKTSFARRFVDIDAPLPTDAESTRGVDIDYNGHKPISLQASFPHLQFEHDVNLHIWDFAGQTAVHPIHSLFLSENCIYVIVYNGRIEAGSHLRYWLEKIRQFGGRSKIYILVNLYDTHKFEKTFTAEKREFAENNIEVVEASIAFDKWGMPESRTEQKLLFNQFREMIALNLAKTQKPLAAHVVRIKEYLDEHFNGKTAYIKFEAFSAEVAKIMEKEFPSVPRDAQSISEFLTTFLHTLGIALYYKELRGFEQIVLNPMWIAGAVYEVVDYLKSNGEGRISQNEIKSILTGSRNRDAFSYTDVDTRYIYKLLLEYKLAYEYKDKLLIVPLCMSDNEPTDEQPPFPDGETLSIQFRAQNKNILEYMPEEVIPQFIVAVHDNIYKTRTTQLVWRKGVILKKGNAIAKAVQTDASTITLSAVDKNGGAEYLRELKAKMENVLSRINRNREHISISYAVFDVDGRITDDYFKDAEVEKWTRVPQENRSDDYDYEKTGKTYGLYIGRANFEQAHIGSIDTEHVNIEHLHLKVPENLTDQMVVEFRDAMDKFLKSDVAEKLITRDFHAMETELANMDQATGNKLVNSIKKIVQVLSGPEVSAIANTFQILGVSLYPVIEKIFQ